jgi:hypothetical protein
MDIITDAGAISRLPICSIDIHMGPLAGSSLCSNPDQMSGFSDLTELTVVTGNIKEPEDRMILTLIPD